MIHRGDFVSVVVAGDFGKSRPALVVQSDLFATLPSLVICPLTTTLRNDADLFRIQVEPDARNGLQHVSQISVDKISAIMFHKVGSTIGRADAALMLRVERAIAVLLGIA